MGELVSVLPEPRELEVWTFAPRFAVETYEGAARAGLTVRVISLVETDAKAPGVEVITVPFSPLAVQQFFRAAAVPDWTVSLRVGADCLTGSARAACVLPPDVFTQ